MKEKYTSPSVVSADSLSGEGLVPIAVAGVTVKAAAALLAGYAAGRAVTKAVGARPYFKMPSLKILRSDNNGICMA